jgi:hypothetical protein
MVMWRARRGQQEVPDGDSRKWDLQRRKSIDLAQIIQSPRRKPASQVHAAHLPQKSGLDRPRGHTTPLYVQKRGRIGLMAEAGRTPADSGICGSPEPAGEPVDKRVGSGYLAGWWPWCQPRGRMGDDSDRAGMAGLYRTEADAGVLDR